MKKDLIYVDKHTQPSAHTCMGSLLEGIYGSITAEKLVHELMPAQQTADLHGAVYAQLFCSLFLCFQCLFKPYIATFGCCHCRHRPHSCWTDTAPPHPTTTPTHWSHRYDFATDRVFLGVAGLNATGDLAPAYARPWFVLDAKALLGLK